MSLPTDSHKYAFLDKYEKEAFATTPEENPYSFVQEAWKDHPHKLILLRATLRQNLQYNLPVLQDDEASALLEELFTRKRDIEKWKHELDQVLDAYESNGSSHHPTQNPYRFEEGTWKDCPHKSILLRDWFYQNLAYDLPVLQEREASALVGEILRRKRVFVPPHREPHMSQFSQQYVTTHMPQFSQQYVTPHMPQFSQQYVTPHKSPFTLTPPSAARRYEEIEVAPEGYTDTWLKDGRDYTDDQKYEYSEYYYRKRAWRYAKEQPRYPGSQPLPYNPFHEGDEAYNARDAEYQQEKSAFFRTYREEKDKFLSNLWVKAAIVKAPPALRDFIYSQ
jgi:hypothetical protein